MIKKTDFEKISENYIDAIQAIRIITESIENGDYGPLKINCYICGKKGHLA